MKDDFNRIAVAAAGILFLIAGESGINWAAVGFGAGRTAEPGAALSQARGEEVPSIGAVVPTGYIGREDPSGGGPSRPVEFVTIAGGRFLMGTDDGDRLFEDAKPIREVAIRTFAMSKSEVTVEQYAECVGKGACRKPKTGDYCNWGLKGRERHPVNCVDWDQAKQFAAFKGARLPSESEWEYAATNGGKNQKYPWGNEEPTDERTVMSGNATRPVCSKPAGNTVHGLCDLAGNVWEWLQDKYQDSYSGAPTDGTAFEAAGPSRVVRGGSFARGGNRHRADWRNHNDPNGSFGDLGFRIAKSVP